jgi:hypothetical protein
MGLIIMLPYAAAMAFNLFLGVDTSPILSSIFGDGVIKPSAILSVVILLFLRTYNAFILILGTILLGIGVSGKGYKLLSPKEDDKEAQTKESDKSKEPEKKEKKY